MTIYSEVKFHWVSYILHTKSGNPNFEVRAGGGGSQGWRSPQEKQGRLGRGDQRDGGGGSSTELPSPSVSLGWTNSPLGARGEASAATCWGAEARRHSDLWGARLRGDRTSWRLWRGGAGEILLLPGGRSEPLATAPILLLSGVGGPQFSGGQGQPHAASVTRAPLSAKAVFFRFFRAAAGPGAGSQCHFPVYPPDRNRARQRPCRVRPCERGGAGGCFSCHINIQIWARTQPWGLCGGGLDRTGRSLGLGLGFLCSPHPPASSLGSNPPCAPTQDLDIQESQFLDKGRLGPAADLKGNEPFAKCVPEVS